MALLSEWVQGFVPLNEIERSVSELIDARTAHPVERTVGVLTAEDALAMVEPGDLVIDCTGSKSLLRDHLTLGAGDVVREANTLSFVFEHALVVTFLYGQTYVCNEYCKYYKNVENPRYKFIPMVHRVCHDGDVSHVTGIVSISAEEYEAMPKQFDGEWLRENFPGVAQSMDRFIDKVKEETTRRARRRPRGHPDPAQPLPRAQRHQPSVGHGGPERPSARHHAGVPHRRLGHRLSVLPVDLARLQCAMHLAFARRAARPIAADMLIATSSTSTSSGSRLYAEQDDQEQQGSSSPRRPVALLDPLHIY